METRFSCKNFRERTVNNEPNCQLLDIIYAAHLFRCTQCFTADEMFHDFHQRAFAHFMDTRQRLCQNLAVASVAAEIEIVLIQQIRLPDACSFLTNGQVRRSGICGIYSTVATERFNAVEHCLKFTQDGDITINANQIVIPVFFPLLRHCFMICVDGNILKGNGIRLSHLLWIYI